MAGGLIREGKVSTQEEFNNMSEVPALISYFSGGIPFSTGYVLQIKPDKTSTKFQIAFRGDGLAFRSFWNDVWSKWYSIVGTAVNW